MTKFPHIDQIDLFDATEADRLKREGMAAAAHGSKHELLDHARRVAKQIAMLRGSRTVTADDVGRAFANEGIRQSLGNAAGSLFRGSDWQFTGQRIKSVRKSNHSREIKVWRFIGKEGDKR
jgi:hypothetical protein|tara:strand:- start:104 stop:466 length:363 start_codon:yes stop_codon:yes gene_type:complete